MPTRWIATPVLALFVSCAGPERAASERPAPAASQRVRDTATTIGLQTPSSISASKHSGPSRYSLTDTTDWANMLEEGERAILRRGGVIIDTVDLAFGVAHVGQDSLVFHPVRTDTLPIHVDSTTVAYEKIPIDHVFLTPDGRRELRHFLPFFHEYGSSPAIAHESVIHYWGIAPEDTTNRLYAMRYDFRTARLDSLFLNRRDRLATDYRYYLRTPKIRGDEVAFDRLVLDAGTWRVIREEPPSDRQE